MRNIGYYLKLDGCQKPITVLSLMLYLKLVKRLEINSDHLLYCYNCYLIIHTMNKPKHRKPLFLYLICILYFS